MLHRRADKVVVEDDPELSAPPEWRTKTPAKFARLRRLHALHAWLVQPVHASTVGMMRIFFSACMYWQAQHFSDVFDEFLTSKQVFPYPGLGWVAPCGPALGRAILRTNSIAAVMTGAGVLTKPATLVLFLTFTYVFLLCESNHNNHYILICHVTFVASALDWGRYASVDAVAAHFWRRWTDRADKDKAVVARPEEVATVPYWNLLLLQLLFSIPCAAGPSRRNSGAAIPAQSAERVFAILAGTSSASSPSATRTGSSAASRSKCGSLPARRTRRTSRSASASTGGTRGSSRGAGWRTTAASSSSSSRGGSARSRSRRR